ncbi:MAG: hypothetical protein JEZ04_16850 [Spirochaetales bacterium]|nr:hypothetical protein [Spirochaetales bacterium]
MKLLPSVLLVTIITSMLFFTSCDPNALSEAESIAIDKALLEIVYSGSDTATSVNANVTLASTGSSGTVITWESNCVNVITAAGVVTRPAFADGNCPVVLTATLTKDDATDTKTFNLIVICLAATDAEAVSADKAALNTNNIIFAAGDTATSITGDFTLPSIGSNGTTITWESNLVNVITAAGVVTRPAFADGNCPVVLTATLTKDDATDTKTFNLIVICLAATDAEAVSADKAALNTNNIIFAAGDTATSITGDFTLPSIGSNGTTITWESNLVNVITAAGVVTRPAFADGNCPVVLTATLTKDDATDTKTFNLIVICLAATDAEAVSADKAALNTNNIIFAAGDTATSITGDFTLPSIGSNGTTITWESNLVNVITAAGVVTRPAFADGNCPVVLTATLTKDDATDTKTFNLIVICLAATDAEAVSADKAALNTNNIIFAAGDTATSITGDFTLPSIGSNGTTITWESNLVNVITAAGVVTRPSFSDGDCPVVLTATLTKEEATDTKTFALTVICLDATDTDLASANLDTNDIIFTTGDTATSVTADFTLPLTGTNETTISWAEGTDTANAVSISGNDVTVSRPRGNGSNDASVTIRATISKSGITDTTKDLTIIISDIISIANSPNGNRLAVASDGTRYYLEGKSLEITAVHKSSDGREWTTLSSTGLPTGPETAYYGSSIAVDSKKTVYVLSNIGNPCRTNVYKLSDGGTSWSLVGNEDFATESNESTGRIVIDSNDKPIAMANVSSALHVFELVENVWTDISPETTSYKADIYTDGSDIYYVHGAGSSYYSVYKRNSESWSKITDTSNITGEYNFKYPSISVDSGIVTVAVVESGSVKVVRWELGSWTVLSSGMPKIDVSQNTCGYIQALTIASVSYLAAHDGTLIKYSSGSWSKLSDFTSCSSAGINTDYDPTTGKIVVLNGYPSSGSWFMLDVTP